MPFVRILNESPSSLKRLKTSPFIFVLSRAICWTISSLSLARSFTESSGRNAFIFSGFLKRKLAMSIASFLSVLVFLKESELEKFLMRRGLMRTTRYSFEIKKDRRLMW